MSTKITTTSNPRPIKVVAFLLCLFAFFLMVVAIAASNWMSTDSGGWREGLFEQCVLEGTPTPLPFGMEAVPGCFLGRFTEYILASIILSSICIITVFVGVVFMGSGLQESHPRKKYKKYKIATAFLTLALISVLLVVVLYPVLFFKDLEAGDNNPVLDGQKVVKNRTKSSPSAIVSNIENTEIGDEQQGIVNEDKEETPEGSGGNALRVKRQESPNDELLLDEQNENETANSQLDAPVEKGDNDTIDDIVDVAAENGSRNVEDFSFGFGYGCVFVSAIFILIGLLILICDQTKEEIYYKEIVVELSEMQDVKE